MRKLILILILITNLSLAQSVTVYANRDYGNSARTFSVGTATNMGHHNPSLWKILVGDCNVCNDEISAIKIPPGLKVTVWENENFQGDHVTYTSDTSWLGEYWNDKVSSLKVEYNVPPTTLQPQQDNGVVIFRNQGTTRVILYYVMVLQNSSPFNYCAYKQEVGVLYPNNNSLNVPVKAGYVTIVKAYLDRNCGDLKYETSVSLIQKNQFFVIYAL